jgi:hypothetical protein
MIVKYFHHNKNMSVQKHLKGKHGKYCLCYQNCKFFSLDNPNLNCDIANKLFQFNIENNIVTPVFECEKYDNNEKI